LNEIRFIDVFSGIGGFRLGLEKAGGYRCVWSCDWDKYASKVYARHFGGENHYAGDVRQVEASSIPDHDVLCAGFPCQAFSVAGKRRGFEDPRGTLFYEVTRIARAKRPRILFLENVKGLLSHDDGHTFRVILEELGRIGYHCEWQILNSKWFGVPQRRERVFIIGHLGGEPKRTVFPIRATGEDPATGVREAQNEQTACAVTVGYGKLNMRGSYIATALDANYWKGPDNHNARTLIAYMGDVEDKLAVPVLTPNRAKKRQSGRRFKEPGDPMFTLTGQDVHSVLELKPLFGTGRNSRGYRVYDPSGVGPTLAGNAGGLGAKTGLIYVARRIRRLTPLECERLQGFPDNWTEFGYKPGGVVSTKPIYGWEWIVNEEGEPDQRCIKVGEEEIDPVYDAVRISDKQRYKMLGNAVSVPVIEFIGRRIKEVM